MGDVACAPGEPTTEVTCQQEATADLTSRLDPAAVIGLGDLQYDAGALDAYRQSWAQSWGRFDDLIAPVPGNHEYGTAQAGGFEDYFGQEAWSVRDIGAWRVYLLDSTCELIACDDEATWLREDLAAHPDTCTAIAMHYPRVSSGQHGPNPGIAPLWAAAVEGGVDVALSGHDHDYERFSRLDTNGEPTDGATGIRQFVIGTGGKSLYPMRATAAPGSQFHQNTAFGVLDLTLSSTGYAWRFVDTADQVLDSGSDTCA